WVGKTRWPRCDTALPGTYQRGNRLTALRPSLWDRHAACVTCRAQHCAGLDDPLSNRRRPELYVPSSCWGRGHGPFPHTVQRDRPCKAAGRRLLRKGSSQRHWDLPAGVAERMRELVAAGCSLTDRELAGW